MDRFQFPWDFFSHRRKEPNEANARQTFFTAYQTLHNGRLFLMILYSGKQILYVFMHENIDV